MSKFSSQLSAERLPLSRSAGQRCPWCFFTVLGDEGQKFHNKAKARTRNSAEANVPWKYWALNTLGRETSSTDRPDYWYDAPAPGHSYGGTVHASHTALAWIFATGIVPLIS